ncbi:predicted protein [Plenodomus lingam JN3]|uniref:Predicted protein n=1 Tax=Leptosphaeria maculans (strain JN3 / isolate v23.1.3 / race Av1-4-5-6-7-8) TaxID=985895 RepID=E5AEF1_LEPMJ|nr:predicted protein [Plenodomus lingam JN3]CBY01590.1 predicted protein [Plenodomus lingam JN3]
MHTSANSVQSNRILEIHKTYATRTCDSAYLSTNLYSGGGLFGWVRYLI